MNATVLITAYNYGPYIQRAIRSALNQTMESQDYEILVVDDGSTDDTSERLQSFYGQIRIHRQPNQGLAAACNAGIEMAQGEYLIRLDADDEFEPEALVEHASVLDQHPEVGLVCADRWEIDSEGNRSLVKIDLANIFDIIAPGIMFRTECLHAVGMYRPLYWEEYDLMVRLRQHYKTYHLKKPLYRYYLHGQNMTANARRRRQGWAELLRIWGINELRRWGHSEELESVWADMEGLNDD